jgi:hypothetical protein
VQGGAAADAESEEGVSNFDKNVCTCGCAVAGREKVAELRAEIERLRALCKELADDLRDEIEGRYQSTKSHPAMHRQYERDMTNVYRARDFLGGKSVGNDDESRK